MPEMDGLEATAIIRRGEHGGRRRLPIIAMTAHALPGDRERCLDAGMDGYTSKPINAEELFATIEQFTAAEPGAQPPAEEPAEDPVDWPAALKSVRDDEQLLTLIVGTALAEIPELLAGIRKAVTGNDGPTLRRTAHTLRGSIRYFGARRVIDLATRLESMGQAENFHSAREVLPLLGDASDQLLSSLANHAARSNGHKTKDAQEVAT
jgi:two-component system, sensor histidine kinase and response regulator